MHPSGPSRHLTLEDGRTLHARVSGEGAPTVLFESGMGFSSAAWGLVQPAVARATTTAIYDRAGSGGSDDDPEPRTLDRIGDDLAQVLRTLPGPYVLVGHSWGGPIVRSVTATGEFDIRGLVLIDPSDEHIEEFFTPGGRRRMAVAGPVTTALARTGAYRLFARAGRAQPPEVYKELQSNFGTRGARMMAAEARHFLPGMERLREEDAGPSVDVTIITGTRANRAERAQRTAVNRAHRTSAERWPRARLVEAERSGHLVMFTEPELVANEIVRLVDANR